MIVVWIVIGVLAAPGAVTAAVLLLLTGDRRNP